jgi:hypothetical protein
MKLRTWVVMGSIGAAAAVTASPAAAQTDGQTGPEGIVLSQYELKLGSPGATLSTFPKAKTYTTSFSVAVTTTEPDAYLSLADGDVTRGAKRGRLASGSRLLEEPLEARVGSRAFAPLNLAVDTPLARLSGPASNLRATVRLRQRVETKTSGRYGKLLLTTLSTETP